MTRSPRSSIEAALLLGLLIAAGAWAQSSQPRPAPEDPRAQAREVLADPRYQRELPPHDETGGSSPPGLPGGGGGSILLPALGAGFSLARLILFVLLGVAILLAVLWLSQAVARKRRGRPKGESPAAPEEEARRKSPADALLADASRLAAQGLYGEAIHVLLLVAMRHLAERSRVTLQESRTSREVARLLPLGPEARPVFDELVRAVELSLFGGLPAGPEDYERNLARFRQLTGPTLGRPA